jgi:ribosomal protein S3AE
MAQAKKRKKFFDVEMPILRKQTQLLALEQKELEGKFITYDLTRILKGKNALLQLKVYSEGDKLTSSPRELRILPNFIKRMVRKGTDYVEDSLKIICKDAELTMKPISITRKKVSRKVKNGLREKAKQEIEAYCKSKDTENIFDDLLKNKLQKELSLSLKKIYPLSLCEIRMIKVEKKLEVKEPATPKGVPSKEGKEEVAEEKKEDKDYSEEEKKE